jgi:hypothetical protein
MLRRVALVTTTLRNIPEDAILHSHRREELKPYKPTLHSAGMNSTRSSPKN